MKACIGCGELISYPSDHAVCQWKFNAEQKEMEKNETI